MDLSPWAAAKFVIPKLPWISYIALYNKLGWSAASDKQDTITEITAPGLKDPGIKGQIWISKARCPAPDREVLDAVVKGIKELGNGTEQFTLPDINDVEGEWTGYKATGDKNTPRDADLDEKQHFEHLMQEVTHPTTILYFHGGAYFLMDPASHRPVCSKLAKVTGGRCFSVRYRLAPQHPFPSQLLDALIAYLYLLAPPPGSFHKAVPAKNIVFAGDSAGGHLAFTLMLLILTLRRAGMKSVRYHGQDVPLELPAAVAGNSPWLDITRSSPSLPQNCKYDYIKAPGPTGQPSVEVTDDDIWPTKPPRADIFCQASMLDHPLVSPLVCSPQLLRGAPPFFCCLGTENLEDEISTIARKLHSIGIPVEFVGYEGMPHCFAMLFPTTPRARDCMERWATFCKNAVDGGLIEKPHGKWAKAFSNPLLWSDVELGTIGLTDEEVKSNVQKFKQFGVEREAQALQKYQTEQNMSSQR